MKAKTSIKTHRRRPQEEIAGTALAIFLGGRNGERMKHVPVP